MIFITRQSRAIPIAIGTMILALSGIAPSMLHAQAPLGSLEWRAAQARAAGEQRIVFESKFAKVEGGLDEALRSLTIVLVRPVDSSVVTGTDSVTTWYKFKVIEVLSRASTNCAACERLASPPAELQPVHADEVAVPVPGGTAIVDGVTIVDLTAGGVKFKPGSLYLLLLSGPIDPRRVAGIVGCRSGIYGVDEAGNLHTTELGEGTSLSKDVTSHISIGELRTHVNELRTHINQKR